jgi:4a-hydroxytetrahydrobiopterin dehydratase
VTTRDAELARQLSALAQEFRLTMLPGAERGRTVQALELGIDTLDIAKIRPFWKAVLGYADEAEGGNGLADPEGNEACITTWQGRD